MVVFQVGVTGLYHRFTGSMCAVEGVAVAAVVVPLLLQKANRVREVGPSSLTACVDKEKLGKYPSYFLALDKHDKRQEKCCFTDVLVYDQFECLWLIQVEHSLS